MLIACESCHRQYDVGDLKVGSNIRCKCGELCSVPERKTREARTIHCSSCGGKLKDGDVTCSYCSSSVELGERGYGESCPECFARMVKGAGYCSDCGTKIDPELAVKGLADAACPRCEVDLMLREIPGGTYTECPGCGGIWLAEAEFERISKNHEESAVAQNVFLPHVDHGQSTFEEEVVYLKCPSCSQHMNRRNFARTSGVIIDWCKGHGYWFDKDELSTIIHFIRKGGLQDALEREKRQAEAAIERARRQQQSPMNRPMPYMEPPRGRMTGNRGDTLVDALADFISDFF